MSFTEQSTHTALAAAICRNALPVEPIGKKRVGSASRHLAVFLHTPLSSNIDPRALTSLFPPGATREQGIHEKLSVADSTNLGCEKLLQIQIGTRTGVSDKDDAFAALRQITVGLVGNQEKLFLKQCGN